MKKLITLLMLVVCGVGMGWAQTTLTSDYTFIAQTAMDGNPVNSSTNYDPYIKSGSTTSNGYSTTKGTSTINGTEYLNCMQIKGSRGIYFKVGKTCKVTIYGQVNGTRTFMISTSNGSTGDVYTCPSTGGVYEYEIPEKYLNKNLYIIASGDLYLAGLVFTFGKEEIADNDVTIKSLSVNGTVLGAAENGEYNMQLPFGTDAIPTISVTPKHENATVDITNPTTLPGSATVKVTAKDGTTTAEYKVNYTLSDMALSSVMFSNGFDGFITTDNKINVYYLDGTEEPTVSKVTTTSENITVTNENGKLLLTAPFTSAEYTIEANAVTPGSAENVTFDGTETWIKSGYTYDATKGWRFSKNVEEENNRRISNGSNRIYFFVAPCHSITLTSAVTSRSVIVYRDGVKLDKPTASGAANSTITIAGNPSAPSMIAVVSNQTDGDGGFKDFAMTAPLTYTLAAKDGYYHSLYLDYNAVIPEGVTAYTGTLNSEETTINLTKINGNIIPANTGVVVKADAAGDKVFEETSEIATVDAGSLKGVLAETVATELAQESKVVLTLGINNDGAFGFRKPAGGKIGANKIYLLVSEAAAAKGISMSFDDETTGISEVNTENADNNAETYDLTGRRVNAGAKGLLIRNGKKFIVK